MMVLIFTECAGICATEHGSRLVHSEVWRDSVTGTVYAAESLAPVPDELRRQVEQTFGPSDPDDLGWLP